MNTRFKLLSAGALLLSLAVVAASQDAPRKKAAAPRAGSAAPAASSLAKRPFAPLAGGDTCASPPTTIGSLPFNDSGNTIGAADDVSTILASCGSGYAQTPGPDLIYQFTVGAGNSLTFTLTPTAAWDPKIYILGTCGTGGSCITGADVGGDSAAETISVSGLTPGTYFFYVDSFFAAPAGNSAGPYTLAVTGTFGAVGPTATPTNTPVLTNTPTSTPTVTNTRTSTPTFTVTNTPTSTPTITLTPVGPTNTPTSTPTATQTVAAATATPTNTATTVPASSTPTPTLTAVGGGPGNGPASPVPTLSGWMLALFAVALAAAALFMTRRS